MKNVACLGILVADVIVEPVTKIPESGLLEQVNSITLHTGGNAMTASINLTKLGVNASLVGRVGNDMFGEFLKNTLIEKGVDVSGVKTDASVQTSASVAMLSGKGERSFLHCVGANGAFCYDDINFDVIAKNDIVFVTGTYLLKTFDGVQTMEFLKKCKEMGKTTVLDVCWDASGKWGELINMSMPYIDIFLPSIDEARNIAQKETPAEMADVFMSMGVKSVVIKCGSKGCFVKETKDSEGIMIPTYDIDNVVDTTGAGDSFCSGFIAAYARGKDFEFCAKFGNAVGTHCVMKKGATSGIETYENTIEFMKKKGEKIC